MSIKGPTILEIEPLQLANSNLIVHAYAYDDFNREVVGVFRTIINVGLIKFEVEFTILNIPLVFSLLLR